MPCMWGDDINEKDLIDIVCVECEDEFNLDKDFIKYRLNKNGDFVCSKCALLKIKEDCLENIIKMRDK